MENSRTRVTVSLVGGLFDGVQAEAPRDAVGRVFNELWVYRQPSDQRLTILETPSDRMGPQSLLYRLHNWTGTYPVYHWIPVPD